MSRKPEETLSNRIRREVNRLESIQPGEALGLTGPVRPVEQVLNPDVDPQAFSKSRRRYEVELARIDRSAGEEMTRDPDLSEALAEGNRWADPASLPGGGGGFKGLIRKVLRRVIRFALAPELARLEGFQAASTRIANGLAAELERLRVATQELNAALALYGQGVVPVMDEKVRFAYDTLNRLITENVGLLVDRMDLLHRGLDRRQVDLGTWMENVQAELERIQEGFGALEKSTARGLAMQHRKLESLATPAKGPARPVGPVAAAGGEFAYYQFESQGRGPEEQIRRGQVEYLELLKDQGPVLDLGCGRGEFLELLREAGVPGRGVDSNGDMVEVCRSKDLEVEQADGGAFLADSPTGAWGGIFAAQVVEHVPAEQLPHWLTQAHRTLRPDGLLVLETVNTLSPYALFQHYYRDPTHRRPLHPESYRFLVEAAGFEAVELRFRSPVPLDEAGPPPELPEEIPPELRAQLVPLVQAVDRLRAFLYAPCDVAVIGRKPSDGAP